MFPQTTNQDDSDISSKNWCNQLELWFFRSSIISIKRVLHQLLYTIKCMYIEITGVWYWCVFLCPMDIFYVYMYLPDLKIKFIVDWKALKSPNRCDKLWRTGIKILLESTIIQCSGADPGIYVSGGALDRRGVWGPPRSPAGPGQRPVGGPGGRSPPEAHEN